MCGRRSIGCVYCTWQLVFADIINNDKLLLGIVIDCIHLIVLMYVMIDTWLYTWPYLDTWFYYWLPLLRPFMFCMFLSYSSIYFHHMLTHYMHVHLPFYYTLTWLLSDDPRFAHPDIGCFILLFRCSMKLYMLQGAVVSLYLFQYSCLPFYSYCFYSFLDSTSLLVVIPILIRMLSLC